MPPEECRKMKKQGAPTASRIEAEFSKRVVGRNDAVKVLSRAAHEVLARGVAGRRARKESAAKVLLVAEGGSGR
jgi:ATP-dependent protease Clp ATPase subunit